MPTNKPMSVAEAGRLGIKSSIKKYGVNGHRKRCSDAGRARMHRMTQEERSRVAILAVAARIFYGLHEDGRERWAEMSAAQKYRWFIENVSMKKRSRKNK